jgi:hypothetical protein
MDVYPRYITRSMIRPGLIGLVKTTPKIFIAERNQDKCHTQLDGKCSLT